MNVGSDKALIRWSQGQALFWSRPARDDEYSWTGVTCEECFLHPLLGERFSCLNEDCRSNLCEECSRKHGHSLRKYFLPNRRYPCETLLQSIPFLLDPKSNEKIEPKKICQLPRKAIGFYFSAHWCPPCQAFTPRLAELYEQLPEKQRGLEILFVSCDRDEESFEQHRQEMPWPAVPRLSGQLLKEYFQHSGESITYYLAALSQFKYDLPI